MAQACLRAVCARGALEGHPELFGALMEALLAQLERVPEDFLSDELVDEENNVLSTSLAALVLVRAWLETRAFPLPSRFFS